MTKTLPFPPVPLLYTRDQALCAIRAEVEAALDDGIICPCCHQHAKRYRRSLNSGMAATLCWMVAEYRSNGNTWIDVPRLMPRHVAANREFPRLEYWGLIRQQQNTDTRKRCSGSWMPTPDGEAFADGRTTVPAAAIVFNGNCEALIGEPVSIRDCLGTKFNYAELMGRTHV